MTPAAFKKARKRLGLTQQQLAETMGFSNHSHITRKENGQQGISNQDEKHLAALEENERLRDQVIELTLAMEGHEVHAMATLDHQRKR